MQSNVLVCSVPLLDLKLMTTTLDYGTFSHEVHITPVTWIHFYPFLWFRSTRSVGLIPKTLGHAPGMEQQWNCGYRACSLAPDWKIVQWKSRFATNFNRNSGLSTVVFDLLWQSAEMPKDAKTQIDLKLKGNLASLGGFMQRRVQVRVLWRCNRGSGKYFDSYRFFGCMLHMQDPSPIWIVLPLCYVLQLYITK